MNTVSRRSLYFRVPFVEELAIYQLGHLPSVTLHWDTFHNLELTGEKAEFYSLMENNRDTLRSLSVPGDLIWNSPIHVFRDMVHLELIYPEQLSNMELLLRHNTSLESLIVKLNAGDHTDLWTVLGNNPSALPKLSSLKLACSSSTSRSDIIKLADFVRTKSLRRFDFQNNYVEWEDSLVLLSVLSGSRTLEVLGIDIVTYRPLTPHDWEILEQYVPTRTTALRLAVHTETTAGLWAALVSPRNWQQ